MNRTLALVLASLCLSAAVSPNAAEKPSEAYVKSMKDLGARLQSANTAIKAEDYAAVQKAAASIIEAFTVAEKYWAGNVDATKLVQTGSKAAADLRVSAN